jgi:hypothetical protein
VSTPPVLPAMMRPQSHSLLLQSRIIRLQPRVAALDPPAEAIDLAAHSRIGRRQPSRAQPLQFRPVGIQLRRLPLNLGTPPLELSPLDLMASIP